MFKTLAKIFLGLFIILGFFAAVFSTAETVNPKPALAATCLVNHPTSDTIPPLQPTTVYLLDLTLNHFYFITVTENRTGQLVYAPQPAIKYTGVSNNLSWTIPGSTFIRPGTYVVNGYDTTNVNDPCRTPVTLTVQSGAACSNLIDDDGDSIVDYPADPG